LELRSNLTYPGQLYEGRRREILQATSFASGLSPLLPTPAAVGKKPFEDFERKIQHYLDTQPATPYREAVLQVMRRAEAGARGESPPSVQGEERIQGTQGLVMGERAPDFVVTNINTRQSAGLHQFQGKPTLMVFYNPRSYSAEGVLHFAQRIKDIHGHGVNVAAFALVDTLEAARRQQADFYLNIPIYAAGNMRQAYSVEATPKVIILDGSAVARAAYEGWGPEMASKASAELNRWLPGRRMQKQER
jgi:hypothetical protein